MGAAKEICAQVIENLYESRSLNKSLQDYGLTASQFFAMLREIPLLDNEYTRAREEVAELLAEEIIEIADSYRDPQHARNMIEARKWYTSKMKPSKFGDRIDLNVNQTIDLVGALKDAKERTAQVIDMTPKLVGTSTGLKTCDDTDIETEDPSNDFAKLLE